MTPLSIVKKAWSPREGRQWWIYSNRQLDFFRGRGVQRCAMLVGVWGATDPVCRTPVSVRPPSWWLGVWVGKSASRGLGVGEGGSSGLKAGHHPITHTAHPHISVCSVPLPSLPSSPLFLVRSLGIVVRRPMVGPRRGKRADLDPLLGGLSRGLHGDSMEPRGGH